jgi:hypothetical protein
MGAVRRAGDARQTRSDVLITALILLIAINIPHHINRRYWVHTGLIAWIMLPMYALGTQS